MDWLKKNWWKIGLGLLAAIFVIVVIGALLAQAATVRSLQQANATPNPTSVQQVWAVSPTPGAQVQPSPTPTPTPTPSPEAEAKPEQVSYQPTAESIEWYELEVPGGYPLQDGNDESMRSGWTMLTGNFLWSTESDWSEGSPWYHTSGACQYPAKHDWIVFLWFDRYGLEPGKVDWEQIASGWLILLEECLNTQGILPVWNSVPEAFEKPDWYTQPMLQPDDGLNWKREEPNNAVKRVRVGIPSSLQSGTQLLCLSEHDANDPRYPGGTLCLYWIGAQ